MDFKREVIEIIASKENIYKEVKNKKEKLDLIIDKHKLDGIYLTKNVNFSWFFAGAEHYIDISSEKSASRILITKSDIIVETDNIEKPRLENEELNLKKLINYDDILWYKEHKSRDGKFGSDDSKDNYFNVKTDIKELRTKLTTEEIKRYKNLGRKTGEIIEEVAKKIKIGMTENQIAGQLSKKCYEKGIIPIVNLVAVDNRIFKYRHPLPKNNKLKKYAMLIICAKKWGLVANATRLIHFGPLTKELKDKYNALKNIESIFLDNSRSGNNLGEIFSKSIKQYEKVGYPTEWEKHHQGGLTGYNSREIIANQNTDYVLSENQALAWNPSITGAKIEDTCIIKRDNLDIITETGNWEYDELIIQNKKVLRPKILIRKG